MQGDGDENAKKRTQNASSDEGEEVPSPKKKRKGRPKHYLMWAEPDENEDTVPWSTKKRLAGSHSSKQVLTYSFIFEMLFPDSLVFLFHKYVFISHYAFRLPLMLILLPLTELFGLNFA